MSKNEFSKLVEDLDQKIKKVEQKRERVEQLVKSSAKPQQPAEDKVKKKFEEQKKQAKFRLKEKLTYAAIVFAIGHCLMIPLYMKFPDLFVGMFACASISLGVICIAVIDYT